MPLDLSAEAILEKNKLASDGAWVVLLQLNIEDENPIRICRNTEDVIWGGYTWTRFPFEADDTKSSSKGELTTFTVRVSNVRRTLETFLQNYDGATGAEVIIRVVHAKHLDLADPELEEYFEVMDTDADNKWVYFKLGAPSPMLGRFPRYRYNPNFCRHKFKSARCGYVGSFQVCNHTLANCRERGNSRRFGGHPGVSGGFYV